jgi:hypothetical protein
MSAEPVSEHRGSYFWRTLDESPRPSGKRWKFDGAIMPEIARCAARFDLAGAGSVVVQ